MNEALPVKKYKVIVNDNYHYMDNEYQYEYGSFATADEAIEAAKKIVDEYLLSDFTPGISAAMLYKRYQMFGEDPFIIAEPKENISFSAWDYAKKSCEDMCSSSRKLK